MDNLDLRLTAAAWGKRPVSIHPLFRTGRLAVR